MHFALSLCYFLFYFHSSRRVSPLVFRQCCSVSVWVVLASVVFYYPFVRVQGGGGEEGEEEETKGGEDAEKCVCVCVLNLSSQDGIKIGKTVPKQRSSQCKLIYNLNHSVMPLFGFRNVCTKYSCTIFFPHIFA